MIFGWFIGDVAKTIFYIYKGLPMAFIVGGYLTIFVDFSVLLQYYYFTKCKKNKTSLYNKRIKVNI